MTAPQLQMPLACISCEHYSQVGHDDDKHCPFTNRWGETHGRTSYGQCDLHGQEVFATEICNSHEPEPFVELVDVTNRPEPRAAIQERLL
ncbi:hypothetical protein OZ656_06250 [Marinobacter sp. LM1]|uniref:hypothetical protein n=1 Tax=Marinobacter sp. LM1 TaxID=3003349 RepID=UPI0036D2343A